MGDTDPLIGQTVAGYEILAPLGRGGMGTVYKARQTSLDRIVAVKILPGEYAADQEYIQRFQTEARAAARLNHSNIVQIYDFGLVGQLHYLAMEYIDGEPLSAWLRNYGRLIESDCIRVIMQTCEALSCAHSAGIIHRDIKPDNILLSSSGDVKLCDLGLAKITVGEDLSLTQTGMAVGTPYYISPEQVRGERHLDARTDIYSLGATFYHLVTGRIPFEGPSGAVIMSRHLTDELEDPRLIQPDISYATTCVIWKMMAKHPEHRYSDVMEIYAELDGILNQPDEMTAAPPTAAVEKFVVKKRNSSEMNDSVPLAAVATPPPGATSPSGEIVPPETPPEPVTPAPHSSSPSSSAHGATRLRFKSQDAAENVTTQKKKNIMSILLIILALLAIAGAAIYFFTQK